MREVILPSARTSSTPLTSLAKMAAFVCAPFDAYKRQSRDALNAAQDETDDDDAADSLWPESD